MSRCCVETLIEWLCTSSKINLVRTTSIYICTIFYCACVDPFSVFFSSKLWLISIFFFLFQKYILEKLWKVVSCGKKEVLVRALVRRQSVLFFFSKQLSRAPSFFRIFCQRRIILHPFLLLQDFLNKISNEIKLKFRTWICLNFEKTWKNVRNSA